MEKAFPLATETILEHPFVKQLQQVLPVTVVLHGSRCRLKLVGTDVAVAVSDFLRARNHETLSGLDGLNEQCSFQNGLMSSGIEPGHAPAHHLHIELSA